jgi:hypothetical protein
MNDEEIYDHEYCCDRCETIVVRKRFICCKNCKAILDVVR